VGVLGDFRIHTSELEVNPFRYALARSSAPSIMFRDVSLVHVPVCGSGAMDAEVEWIVIAVFRE
jgi:hypothetical protein